MALKDFLEKAENLYNLADVSNNYVETLEELKSDIKKIQTVLQRISTIHNNINEKYRQSTTFLNRKFNSVIPGEDDWKNISRSEKNYEVAPFVNIGVKYVDKVSDLPNYNMYYVKETNNFAFQINGVIFMGHIGNITKKPLQIKCNKKCKKNCPYYHNGIRNFSTGCWLYTDKINNKTKNMRHIGNRETLFQDIERIGSSPQKDNEIELWDAQIIHDILVTLALHQNINRKN